jgi:hypothetical protein
MQERIDTEPEALGVLERTQHETNCAGSHREYGAGNRPAGDGTRPFRDSICRSPERLKSFGDRISIKQGNLLDSAELEQVIEGHDAVLSAFGLRVLISKADANLLREFAMR